MMRGILAILLGPLAVCARERAAAPAGVAATAAFDHEHRAFGALLARHVKDGMVDYARLAGDARADLDAALRPFEAVEPAAYAGWSDAQKLAFWLNAYNAYALRLVVAHYSVESIRTIGLLPGAAFRTSFIAIRAHGDRGKLSLDDLEQRILRKDFHEPRIHFAIVCASKSCPKLRAEPYRAADLDRQLDEQAREFLRDPTKNRFEVSTRTLRLSRIFDWFGEDFAGEGGLTTFVARYADDAVASELRKGDVRVAFLDYDWSLNGR
ncbi:MAG: DUF547 domain-containing protein [Myxococcota bacterium]